ncbi:hypothetical protein [Listeria fleischmannii]|uniref:hypothetical protein n=1 Tax=Listeria fleischmannii TaxID=1069827 RepID=UPI0020B72819|nr:hypothetical protein [Listeria fleischmannii]
MEQLKISKRSRQHVRELLYKYQDMKKEIALLREAILHPHKVVDANTGGGRSSLTVFESEKAIQLASHEQIAFRAKAIQVIDDVMANSSDQAQMIIELKYFGNKPMSWIAISNHEEIGYSQDSCRKIERAIVDRIGRNLGW